jgi:hypothetical protein
MKKQFETIKTKKENSESENNSEDSDQYNSFDEDDNESFKMSAVFGSIEPYDIQSREFGSWLERFEEFLKVNKIAADNKRSMFITCCGAECYNNLKTLLLPAKPTEKTFDEIKTVLTTYYAPDTVEIAERYHFYKREQRQESIAEYMMELKKIGYSL